MGGCGNFERRAIGRGAVGSEARLPGCVLSKLGILALKRTLK
jgi:hypothetical protein